MSQSPNIFQAEITHSCTFTYKPWNPNFPLFGTNYSLIPFCTAWTILDDDPRLWSIPRPKSGGISPIPQDLRLWKKLRYKSWHQNTFTSWYRTLRNRSGHPKEILKWYVNQWNILKNPKSKIHNLLINGSSRT